MRELDQRITEAAAEWKRLCEENRATWAVYRAIRKQKNASKRRRKQLRA